MEGGYQHLLSGWPQVENRPTCREIRTESVSRGRVRIPVAVSIVKPRNRGVFCLGTGTRKGLETGSDGGRPNQIRTDFSAGLPDLGFGVDPLGVLVLGDQVCVGGEQHCQRVAELLGHVHRLAPFGEQ